MSDKSDRQDGDGLRERLMKELHISSPFDHRTWMNIEIALQRAISAPPKPAPDAPGHTDLMVSPESIDGFMEKNPLPAPDAVRVKQIEVLICERLGYHAPHLWHPESRENRLTPLAQELATLAAPVPSPAVAAEPAAHHHRPSTMHMGDCSVCGNTSDHPWHIGSPSFASPTVRGDRETAREIVTEWLGMFDPPPQIDFQQSEFLQGAIASALGIPRAARPDRESLAQAYAIHRWKEKLDNLPIDMKDDCYNFAGVCVGVQPGAGEREAAIEECAKLVENTLLHNHDNIARDIRALARQAPHSSSEGGR